MFVARPGVASLAPGARLLLEELARGPRRHAAVLSSRGLRNLEARLGRIAGLDLVGSQGNEMRIGGEAMGAPVPMSPGLERIRAVRQAVRRTRGARLEIKPAGLAVHVRGMPPAERRAAWARFQGLALGEGTGAGTASRWIRCREAFEWQSGSAGKEMGFRMLLRLWGAGPGDTVLYAGDDCNDAGALIEARERGGLAIGVGPEPPAEAAYHAPDNRALIQFLRAAARLYSENTSPAAPRARGLRSRARQPGR